MKRTFENRGVRVWLKRASTQASAKYTIGGRRKEKDPPKTITLPKLKCLEDKEG